jgi:predicted transcriptional regulator
MRGEIVLEKTNETIHGTRRRKILELAPLELECMTTLWSLQAGTVREIRDTLAERRPRAYTTIMTIMDRLARKQIVTRQRIGRAWRYQANLSQQEARTHAISQVLESFFGGSARDLLDHVSGITIPADHENGGRRSHSAASDVLAPEPSF